MGSPGSKISIITYSQTLTTNLKEIHQNGNKWSFELFYAHFSLFISLLKIVTIINRMVNESAKDNQTSDRSTKL